MAFSWLRSLIYLFHLCFFSCVSSRLSCTFFFRYLLGCSSFDRNVSAVVPSANTSADGRLHREYSSRRTAYSPATAGPFLRSHFTPLSKRCMSRGSSACALIDQLCQTDIRHNIILKILVSRVVLLIPCRVQRLRRASHASSSNEAVVCFIIRFYLHGSMQAARHIRRS